jgi:hypothetical protein
MFSQKIATYSSINDRFFAELLHILGLAENTEKGGFQQAEFIENGALIENTISALQKDKNTKYLSENEHFIIALQLWNLWLSRIFFLKLVEQQLLCFHEGNADYHFLNSKNIPNFDALEDFWQEIICKSNAERTGENKIYHSQLPHLNLPFFQVQNIEKQYIRISALKSKLELPIYLDDFSESLAERNMPTLAYLWQFLDNFQYTIVPISEEKASLEPISVNMLAEILHKFLPNRQSIAAYSFPFLCENALKNTLLSLSSFQNWEEWKNTNKEVKKKKEVFNQIKIFLPKGASSSFSHLLVNEWIKLKSEMNILGYESGKPFEYYSWENDNLENVLVDTRDGELFQYFAPKPIQQKSYVHAVTGKTFFVEEGRNKTERQLVQEAIWAEKRHFFQECLFVVEAENALANATTWRMWAEMIPNLYYTQESGYTELVRFPHLFQNVKTGNILGGRFSLETEIPIKKNPYSADIQAYKKETQKTNLRQIEKKIGEDKAEILAQVLKKDQRYLRLQKLQTEYQHKFNTTGLFEITLSSEKEAEKQKISEEIGNYERHLGTSKEIKRDFFEMRWEFPEVWDKKGNFKGFDLVVCDEITKNYHDYLTQTLKEGGNLAFIMPRIVLYYPLLKDFRTYLLQECSIQQVVELSNTNYQSIQLFFQKKETQETEKKLAIWHELEGKYLFLQEVPLAVFADSPQKEITTHLPVNILQVLHKIEANSLILKEIAEEKRGATIKKSDLVNTAGMKMLIGQDVSRFDIRFENTFISPNHKEFSRLQTFFQAENIVYVKRNASEIVATVSEEPFAFNKNLYGFVFPENIDKHYALALLNSDLLSAYYRQKFGRSFANFSQDIPLPFCEKLPIKVIDSAEQKELIELVTKLLILYKQNNQTQIAHFLQKMNEKVLDLYGISAEEFETLT